MGLYLAGWICGAGLAALLVWWWTSRSSSPDRGMVVEEEEGRRSWLYGAYLRFARNFWTRLVGLAVWYLAYKYLVGAINDRQVIVAVCGLVGFRFVFSSDLLDKWKD